MWCFWWHWLFHWMRPWTKHFSQDVTRYYLCKCGKAFTVTSGWRKDSGRFRNTEETDVGEMRKFRDEVARDIRTL